MLGVIAEASSDEPLPRVLSPGLYIVATPIGNLGDITLRSIETLRRCDAVACEDTRVTGRLMKHLGLSKPLWRYDDHAEAKDRERLIESMRSRAVALVSDAGTPLISDPGYRLVNSARAEGIAVTVIPGACAAIAGLTLSGLPNDRFLFAGFLPAKDKARGDVLSSLAGIDATLVFYETAPRLTRSLAAIQEAMPYRDVAVARELTKLHEECRRGLPAGLIAWYEAHPPKGEIVLLVGPPVEHGNEEVDADALLRSALAAHKPSQAAAQVAKATGMDRRELYARAMELQKE
ncbi:16S rRNA (cytidine(1402)-2'-O)-methyltransferase [Escherichia coli]|uniref:16S rRNA (cytidine(1402)-2'-O)-methyltransferase n=2 Tax=Escherichia coli TaxID=562 RepID=UPI00092BE8D2|nr:16S rRNA (cytidine(1402)-2'-O)-methyltransferase [Escherichia coli]OJS19299.1 16S rRNA (cytidine(1402)-2'-O)-methyltransferase [Escherichia coli]OJS43140.1 16S rRNA (cytidine(1402)-2'-O)-methyltransferase [Escherichia coli]